MVSLEIMHFISDELTGNLTTLASLEIRQASAGYSMRFAPKEGGSEWVSVPRSSTFFVETLWDKHSNQVTLWIDGNPTVQTISLDGYDGVNRVDLGFINTDTKVQGSLCIDEFAFDDSRINFASSEMDDVQETIVSSALPITPTETISHTQELRPTVMPTSTSTAIPTQTPTPTLTPTLRNLRTQITIIY